MKQFGQRLHRKELQGNEVPAALPNTAAGCVSSSHVTGRDQSEQLTKPAQNNPPSLLPSLQALFSARTVSPHGCKVLVGERVSGRVLPLSCATGGRVEAEQHCHLQSDQTNCGRPFSFSLQMHRSLLEERGRCRR